MPYCTPANVRAICETDISDAELLNLIDESDDILDMMINMSSLTANVRRRLSSLYTALMCFLKDPQAESLGESRYDRSYQLQKLNEEFDRLVRIAGGGIAFQYKSEPLPSIG